MPTFVPKDLWRWLLGPHTSPQMEFIHEYPHGETSAFALPEPGIWYGFTTNLMKWEIRDLIDNSPQKGANSNPSSSFLCFFCLVLQYWMWYQQKSKTSSFTMISFVWVVLIQPFSRTSRFKESSPFFASIHQPMGVECLGDPTMRVYHLYQQCFFKNSTAKYWVLYNHRKCRFPHISLHLQYSRRNLRPPHSDWRQALEWSSYSDWAMLPHIFYFEGVPELFLKLMDMEVGMWQDAANVGLTECLSWSLLSILYPFLNLW